MAVLTTTLESSVDDDDAQASASAKANYLFEHIDELVCESEQKKNQAHVDALALNQQLVHKYQGHFPKIPTMTSHELVARWKQQDREDDAREDSIVTDSTSSTAYSSGSFQQTTSSRLAGPLLLLDVRSKVERAVSIIPGAVSIDCLEKTRWMNRHVHHFYPEENSQGIPTIVLYSTIGIRSGREAQRLVDDLTSTFDSIQIGTSVDIKILDGILSYSFVEDAPPLMSQSHEMTTRIHSYSKEWSSAINPDYDVIYFNAKSLKRYRFQTSVMSAFRKTQHQFSKSMTKKKKSVTNCERSNTSTRSLGGDLRKFVTPVGVVATNNNSNNNNSINNIHPRTNNRTRSYMYNNTTNHAPKIVVGGIGLGIVNSHSTSDLTSLAVQAHDLTTTRTNPTASSSSPTNHTANATTTGTTTNNTTTMKRRLHSASDLTSLL